MNDKWEIEVVGELPWGLRSAAERFLTARFPAEVSGNTRVGKDFHFCAGPTVTAGFIGFVFDIRKN